MMVVAAVFATAGYAHAQDAGRATLTEFASSVRNDPEVELIEISGTTDATGPVDVNVRLGQERAQAVKTFLQVQGVPADKIQTQSVGEAKPVATNESPAGRAMNRSAVVVALK